MVEGMEKRGLGLFYAMMVFPLVVQVQVSNAAMYNVGGSAGWTTIGNIDYQKLADANTFHVGDILIFKYSPMHHNVMRVTNAAYKSCNSSSPIVTYTTGNDSIPITTGGHHYFLCGFPGHCQLGQKVDINVLFSSMASTPSPMPSPSVPTTTMVPVPSTSEAAPFYASSGFFGKIGLAMVVITSLYV